MRVDEREGGCVHSRELHLMAVERATVVGEGLLPALQLVGGFIFTQRERLRHFTDLRCCFQSASSSSRTPVPAVRMSPNLLPP